MNSGGTLPFSTFRDLARNRPPGEKCDLCATPVNVEHAHLLEMERRRILCACTACAILFSESTGRFRRIPTAVLQLPDFNLTDLQWTALEIPINLAFVFRSTVTGSLTAVYPSPAGAIESAPPAEVWAEIVAGEPRLAQLQPDVQALLINRLTEPYEYLLAPIDKCFELIGIVRTHWQGFTGGTELRKQVRAFFEALRLEATTTKGRHA